MEDTANKYAVLQETIPEEYVQVYAFIKYQGNEEALAFLDSQIQAVKWKVYRDDLSCFDIDMDNLVSEEVASAMIRLDLNVFMHRKFDGTLRMIDIGLLPTDKNKKKISKFNDAIGDGRIDEWIDKEDKYEGTLSCSMGSSESESESSSDSGYSSEEESGSEEEEKRTIPKSAARPTMPLRLPSTLGAAGRALKLRKGK